MPRLALRFVPLALLALLACKDPPPPGTPITELTAQKRTPLEVKSISRNMVDLPGGAAVYQVTLKNHSNTTISGFTVVAVLVDGEGKPTDPPTTEIGWAELGGIKADSEVGLSLSVPVPNVARLKLVVKDLVYEAPNPLGKEMGTLSMKWKNASWEDEVARTKP